MIASHAMLDDRDFWVRVEYAGTAWLSSSDQKHLRRFWIDGFIPELIKNTQRGADIEGIAWVGEGSRQHEYRFVASVPQKLLLCRSDFVIDDITVDDTRKQLTLTLSTTSSPNL